MEFGHLEGGGFHNPILKGDFLRISMGQQKLLKRIILRPHPPSREPQKIRSQPWRFYNFSPPTSSGEPTSELEPQIHLRPLSSKYRVLGARGFFHRWFGSWRRSGVFFFSFWVIGLYYLVILFGVVFFAGLWKEPFQVHIFGGSMNDVLYMASISPLHAGIHFPYHER